ncbi:unnamed protein product [Musa acuminata subsp. malaccensis]|uniref:(wild Malaysian banana) hypothetical protein n=1 Tax=Musa acuminata subsp. malaccensis TaxID=214687 RepID=A0A804IQ27_MUSAM|nr:unnamed protein product [Musa acuminata subsp. malaccensis]
MDLHVQLDTRRSFRRRISHFHASEGTSPVDYCMKQCIDAVASYERTLGCKEKLAQLISSLHQCLCLSCIMALQFSCKISATSI